jgi:SAM-dependent methyltransferase
VDHFDKIAKSYDEQIPGHVRQHLLLKKSAHMQYYLERAGLRNQEGVDLGCGTGHHISMMAQAGHKMSGLERSNEMAGKALENTSGLDVEIKVGDVLNLPYEDNSFGFAYAINVFHHLSDTASQVRAIEEAGRILRPGGVFFIQDINCDNLLFRFYMNYVFPLTNDIDDDQAENWISVGWLRQHDFKQLKFDWGRFFTFLPNFVPRFLFPVFVGGEHFMEKVTRGRAGAHFIAAFRKI